MKKKFFKSKLEMFVSIVIFIGLLLGFIYFGSKEYKSKVVMEVNENETIKFDAENIYTTINASDALNYIKGKNVIILFGINDDMTLRYGNLLNNIAKDNGIEEIYYYDVEKDRKDNNASYRSVVEYLSNYVTYFESKTSDIFGPTLLIKSNDLIIYYDDSAAVTKGLYTPDEYFTSYTEGNMNNLLPTIFKDYKEGINNGK